MAPKDIKLNAEEALGHISKIAATMAEVSVPGPVPLPALGTSPIDAALNTVQLAAVDKAKSSSAVLSKRGTEHSAASVKAVETLQGQEEKNTGKIAELQADIAEMNTRRA